MWFICFRNIPKLSAWHYARGNKVKLGGRMIYEYFYANFVKRFWLFTKFSENVAIWLQWYLCFFNLYDAGSSNVNMYAYENVDFVSASQWNGKLRAWVNTAPQIFEKRPIYIDFLRTKYWKSTLLFLTRSWSCMLAWQQQKCHWRNWLKYDENEDNTDNKVRLYFWIRREFSKN